MPLRSSLCGAILLLSLTACDRFDRLDPASGGPAPSASASAVDPEVTRRLSRAALDAALACARSCIIHYPPFDDAADECPIPDADQQALAAATAALSAHARATLKPGDDAAGFIVSVGLFSGWVTQGVRWKRTRGTLKLFQEVADLWNVYQPRDPVSVDPVEEMRVHGFGSKGYIMKPVKKTEGRVLWKSCYDGPCLWENHY